MKIFKLNLLLLTFASLTIMVGCGEKKDEVFYTSQRNTMVRSFALQSDTKILPNLNKIFFSIDLEKAEIFNADSLPYGTNVSSIAISASFYEATNVIINYYKGSEAEVTAIDYLANSTAKIDFSHSNDADQTKVPKMKVIAKDGNSSRVYTIKVNVHKVVADSLYWKELSSSKAPEQIANAKSAKCVKAGDAYYLFSIDKNGVQSYTKTSDFKTWITTPVPLPITPMNWRTLISDENNTLYVISVDNKLFTCKDLTTMAFQQSNLISGYEPYSLIGFLNGNMIAIVKEAGEYRHAFINTITGAATVKPLSKNFPVYGFSSPVTISSQWGFSQLVIACGTLSDGKTYSNAVWGFDGNNWAVLNNAISIENNGGPITPRTGATLFPYYTYTYNQETDVHTKVLTYFIIGGWNGTIAMKDLYYTSNLGGIWRKAEGKSPLQLPAAIKPRVYADAFIINEEVKASPSAGITIPWRQLDVPEMPEILTLMTQTNAGLSAPYIYMVGGSPSVEYSFMNEIWKGVIFRLTFPPIK